MDSEISDTPNDSAHDSADPTFSSLSESHSIPISPILGHIQHIGACHDAIEHRQCVYNVLQTPSLKNGNTTSSSGSRLSGHTPFDFDKLKAKYSKSQRKLRMYKSKTRLLERENDKLQGTSKQLKTMASVIHELHQREEQRTKEQADTDSIHEEKVMTLQEKWESAKLKYERLQNDYDTLKMEKRRWVTPINKYPEFVISEPITISIQQQLRAMGQEIADLKQKNAHLSRLVAQFRSNQDVKEQETEQKMEENQCEMKAMAAGREMDKLEHFLEGQTCNTYQAWLHKKEVQGLRKLNVKFSKEIAHLRVLRVNERNEYERKLEEMRQTIARLQHSAVVCNADDMLQEARDASDILQELEEVKEREQKALELKCSRLKRALESARDKAEDVECREDEEIKALDKRMKKVTDEVIIS